MRQIFRCAGIVLLVASLLCSAIVLLNPSARQLAPIYLYYDLIGQRIAPAPPEIEQFVLQSGQEYCAVGRDSECGGWRLVGSRALVVDQAARQRGTAAAWCVDYVVLRRNQSRTTGGMIYWANIAKAMIVAKGSDGQLASSNVADCRTARLE
ncbi:MAG: hypothetical protein ABIV47_24080 [Roseiflexaceae bacterium]